MCSRTRRNLRVESSFGCQSGSSVISYRRLLHIRLLSGSRSQQNRGHRPRHLNDLQFSMTYSLRGVFRAMICTSIQSEGNNRPSRRFHCHQKRQYSKGRSRPPEMMRNPRLCTISMSGQFFFKSRRKVRFDQAWICPRIFFTLKILSVTGTICFRAQCSPSGKIGTPTTR